MSRMWCRAMAVALSICSAAAAGARADDARSCEREMARAAQQHGIPLGILAVILWLLGLYFAKIVVAQLIGRKLFASAHGVPHYAATLLAGLVIVFIAINLPWVGWLIGIAITLLGLGMIVTYASERSGRTL